MAVCITTLTTAEDGWQLTIWLLYTAMLVGLGYSFMNWIYYAYIESYRHMPPRWIFNTVTIGLVIAGGYAAWRVWSCAQWGDTFLSWCLFIYLLQVIAWALTMPAFSSKNYWFSTVIAVIYLLFTVAVLVLFILNDLYAGIVFIVHTLWAVYWIFIHGMIISRRAVIGDKEKRKEAEEEIEARHSTQMADEIQKSKNMTTEDKNYVQQHLGAQVRAILGDQAASAVLQSTDSHISFQIGEPIEDQFD
jgi:tryptophan-rich sensory protein